MTDAPPTPNLAGAAAYAARRLRRELPACITYHTLAHTRDEVVPAARRIATGEGLDGDTLLTVVTAAWFHDLGFIESPVEHERTGARIARDALPRFGYAPAHLDAIEAMILATRLPQAPRTTPERVIADADLIVLSGEDFPERNHALRRELAHHGRAFTDLAWYDAQLEFLRAHQYFTATARATLNAGKTANLEWLTAARDRARHHDD